MRAVSQTIPFDRLGTIGTITTSFLGASFHRIGRKTAEDSAGKRIIFKTSAVGRQHPVGGR